MRSTYRLFALILAAGFVAGSVAWLGGEACLDIIKAPRHPVNSKGMILNVIDRRQQAVADMKNAGLAFTLLGATLGAGFGVAARFVRGSGWRASSAIIGLVAGAIGCAGMSLALLPAYAAYQRHYPDEASRDLILPFLVHASVWSIAGGAGGLAFGLGLRPGTRKLLPRVVLGGIVGAAVGTAAYELIGAGAFPTAKTSQFLSTTWQTRLLARLAVAVLAAVGVGMSVNEPAERPTSPAT
jgi:hypothetical protein